MYFLGIHQFVERHAQRQRLAIAFRDAEPPDEPRRNLAGIVVGLEDFLRRVGVAVKSRQPRNPVSMVLFFWNVRIPRITRPGLVPDPVAVPLLAAADRRYPANTASSSTTADKDEGPSRRAGRAKLAHIFG